jgi:hypothetical protein
MSRYFFGFWIWIFETSKKKNSKQDTWARAPFCNIWFIIFKLQRRKTLNGLPEARVPFWISAFVHTLSHVEELPHLLFQCCGFRRAGNGQRLTTVGRWCTTNTSKVVWSMIYPTVFRIKLQRFFQYHRSTIYTNTSGLLSVYILVFRILYFKW